MLKKKKFFEKLDAAIWLIPEVSVGDSLISLQKEIFAKKNYVVPHITIFQSDQMTLHSINCALGKINFHPFELEFTEVETSSAFFKNLTFKVKMTKQLQSIYNSLKSFFPESTYELEPHLSMNYGTSVQNGLLNEPMLNKFLGKKMLFDQISVCSPENGWDDINNWHIIAAK